jgi:hypothetical protein
MDNGGVFWRLVMVAVVAYFAIKLVLWVIGAALSLLHTAFVLAVVVGIIWVLVQVLSKRKAY